MQRPVPEGGNTESETKKLEPRKLKTQSAQRPQSAKAPVVKI